MLDGSALKFILPLSCSPEIKLNAVYEVLYDGDDAYEIDHLIQDFHAGFMVFCNL
jgi:hypothetical protein